MKIRFSVCILSVLFAGLFAFGWGTTVEAAPAAPIDLELEQPDGSLITVRQWGDEWLHGFETLDGYTLLQAEGGWWVYAELSSDGNLVPHFEDGQTLRAGIAEPKDLEVRLRPERLIPEGALASISADQVGSIGDRPILVLLASFTNRNTNLTPVSHFRDIIFGATGSVKDFYLQASFNNLNFVPAPETHNTDNDGVIGWLNLGYNHPNTGILENTDQRNQKIVKDALIAADPYINYATFDKNGDGAISSNELQILVVVAGFERSYSNMSPSVWAHRWILNTVGPPSLDGVVLGDYYKNGGYCQVGEIHHDHPLTFGIIAHELGHDIGWPDFYDTSQVSEGVGDWDIMAGGGWNRTGNNLLGTSPALPNAWAKWYQGWLTPTEVNGTLAGASIQTAATNPKAFLLRPNPNGVDWIYRVQSGTGEFFMVENRQLISYDAGLPGSGLLIWHIDESVTNDNSANANYNHPLIKLMQADGLDHLSSTTNNNRGDAGDPFPGTNNNRTFNATSNPNSRLYSGADSLVEVTNISNSAATMTANLTYGQTVSTTFLDVPTTHWAYDWIEKLFQNGITTGCGGNYFCPDQNVTRDQMAIFILRSMYGRNYQPPAVGASTGFYDVTTSHWAAPWIKQLAAEGITTGCGGGNYCPSQSVSRDQMAIFILRGMYGASYQPPDVGSSTGFYDVPTGHWAAPWIKQLAAEGITTGCGNGNYCPSDPVTRDQMAVFLVKAFLDKQPPPSTDPIKNGDFEAGRDGSWTEYSLQGWDLIVQFNPGMAHSGSYGAWLGGDHNEISRLSQVVTIPTNLYYLHFYFDIYSKDACGYDFARLKINNVTFHTFDLCESEQTSNWVHAAANLSAYKGTTVTIQFEVTTDDSLISSFYMDTVSLSSSSLAPERDAMPFVPTENFIFKSKALDLQ